MSYCNVGRTESGKGVAALKFICDVGFNEGANSEVTTTVRGGRTVSLFDCEKENDAVKIKMAIAMICFMN